MQDSKCRARDIAGHQCVDKLGASWRRTGTTCWYETLATLEDERRAFHDQLGRVVDEALAVLNRATSS